MAKVVAWNELKRRAVDAVKPFRFVIDEYCCTHGIPGDAARCPQTLAGKKRDKSIVAMHVYRTIVYIVRERCGQLVCTRYQPHSLSRPFVLLYDALSKGKKKLTVPVDTEIELVPPGKGVSHEYLRSAHRRKIVQLSRARRKGKPTRSYRKARKRILAGIRHGQAHTGR